MPQTPCFIYIYSNLSWHELKTGSQLQLNTQDNYVNVCFTSIYNCIYCILQYSSPSPGLGFKNLPSSWPPVWRSAHSTLTGNHVSYYPAGASCFNEDRRYNIAFPCIQIEQKGPATGVLFHQCCIWKLICEKKKVLSEWLSMRLWWLKVNATPLRGKLICSGLTGNLKENIKLK